MSWNPATTKTSPFEVAAAANFRVLDMLGLSVHWLFSGSKHSTLLWQTLWSQPPIKKIRFHIVTVEWAARPVFIEATKLHSSRVGLYLSTLFQWFSPPVTYTVVLRWKQWQNSANGSVNCHHCKSTCSVLDWSCTLGQMTYLQTHTTVHNTLQPHDVCERVASWVMQTSNFLITTGSVRHLWVSGFVHCWPGARPWEWSQIRHCSSNYVV